MEYQIVVKHLKSRFKFIKELEKLLQDNLEKETIENYQLKACGINPIIVQNQSCKK